MRALIRSIFAATCAVLCFAAGALWVRSTVRGDQFHFDGPDHGLLVRSIGGMVVVNWIDAPYIGLLRSIRRPLYRAAPRENYNTHFSGGNPWTRLGFWWQRDPFGWGNVAGTSTWVAVPYWFIVLITAIPAAAWLRRRWRKRAAVRWRAEGRCTSCGYDLRASPGRCPECGVASEIERTSDAVA